MLGVMNHHFCTASQLRALLAAAAVFLNSFAAGACELPFEIPKAVLEKKVLILGELHGTKEAPHFAGEIACTMATGETEVVLALEIPAQEQQRIEVFLGSAGLPNDKAALLQGEFWVRPGNRQDGRSSEAKVQLLDRVRKMRRAGSAVSVVAIDGVRTGMSRDATMAQYVREIAQSKARARIIALVGNVHALKDRGAFFDKNYESLAYLLSDLDAFTLDIQHKSGAAWVCINECGPRTMTPQPWVTSTPPGTYLGEGPDTVPRHHGTVVLQQATVSMPATVR
jgi:hypothetical protein